MRWGLLFLTAMIGQWDGQKVSHSPSEWLQILGKKRYHIMRQKGTEEAFLGKYVLEEAPGIYHCAACDLPLFDASQKMKGCMSHPNFFSPIHPKNVYYLEDYQLRFKRYEVLCRCCDSHLGHVFQNESGSSLRYCVNSIALQLKFSRGMQKK